MAKITWRNSKACNISLRREGPNDNIVVTATYACGFSYRSAEIKYVYKKQKNLHSALHKQYRHKSVITRKKYLDILASYG